MSISLSPMDYYFYRASLYTIQFVFEYSGRLDPVDFEKSLNQTLTFFPVVASRLKIVSDSVIVFEPAHSVPVRFRILSHELELTNPSVVDSCVDPIENRESQPLLKILITETPARTLIGISFSHMLGDGASLFHFLSGLSASIYKRPFPLAPVNERSLLDLVALPFITKRTLFDTTGYVYPRPSTSERFSIEALHYEKSNLKQQIKTAKDQHFRLSTNSFIMADLAKRYFKDIPLYDNKFIVRCPVDYRKIMTLPDGYFGNAVRDAVAIFSIDEMETFDIFQIAQRIQNAIREINIDSVHASLQSLKTLRKQFGISIFENVGCPGLLISNFSRFPIPEVDLGLGSPIGFHHASLNPRLALILPPEASAKDCISVRFKRPIPSSLPIVADSTRKDLLK